MSNPAGAHETPPPAVLMQALFGKFISKSVSTAADFGFADMLAQGPMTAEALAARAGTHPDATARLLRALSAIGIFSQIGARTFANNAVSEGLRSDVPGSMRAMARWINCPTGWEPWGELGHSVRTGTAATEHLFGTDLFAWLNTKRPDDAEHFNAAMTSFSGMVAMAVAEAYDFSGVGQLVDVGGGRGALLTTILQKNPKLRGVLMDLPIVVEGATALVAASGVGDRVERVGGDFLQGVPAGADAYIMKAIIHDWDDARCTTILSNCAKAMKPGGRVLVVEQVITDGPESIPGKLIDLEMLVMTPGGRERTAEEYAALFAGAGLRLTRIVPTQSMVQVIEGVKA